MSKDFLNSLASVLEGQFSIGENKTHTLDSTSASGDQTVRYGALGQFSSKFDRSQERRYFEQGYLRTDSFNAIPRQAEVYFQEPTSTVLVKKRAFSSLAENFKEENLDKEERIFVKATKTLFQNKTIQISAFENLCKAQKILEKDPSQSSQLMPIIIAMIERISDGKRQDQFATSSDISGLNKLKSVTDKIKTLYAFSSQSTYTTWITDATNPWKSTFGQGTGVIELTNVKSFTTTTSVSLNEGHCRLTFSDPYNLMTITSYDIERAISDATNIAYNSNMYQFGKDNLKLSINNLKSQLDAKRLARGASKIQFVVNPNTVLGKRVRAIIDDVGIEIPFTYSFSESLGFGNSVDVSEDYIMNGSVAGLQGLNKNKQSTRTILSGYGNAGVDSSRIEKVYSEPGVSYKTLIESSEFTLFGDIISSTFDLLAMEENARQNIKKNNQETNYVRKKMRLHYLGKSIIQPMDQVHIYISSKSKEDRKILGGMRNSFKGLQFKQELNKIVANFDTISASFKPSSDVYAQIEKSVFVGDSFPTWLWPFFRDAFINDNDGTHVFGGIVTSATSSYSSGTYSFDCGASTMAEYFNQGRFNWKPSVNVFNGELLDPLTIYKSRFDSVNYDSDHRSKELLEENEKIVNSGFIRFNSGNNPGATVTKRGLTADQEIGALGQRKSIVYEPDGLVHRWKEGIGTLTRHSMYSGNSRTGYQPSFYEEPFVGQDIMNIVSILVTGVPYNFVTYFKSALKFGTEKVDTDKLKRSIQSQMSSIRGGISKNNMIWGNFVPFKNLVVNDREIINTISAQATISKKNSEISAKLEKIAKAQNVINKMTFQDQKKYEAQINEKYEEIVTDKLSIVKLQADFFSDLPQSIQDTLVSSDTMKNISIVGDDISYDNYGANASDHDSKLFNVNNSSLNSDNVRKKVRKKINFLTRRFARDVRANQDKNLFIVDDNYDKDYDIWAFNAKNSKLQLFNSEYSSVKEKIERLSSFLDLEIFCDTQGHIRARSPQYNKMPSSVFFKLIKMKNEYGIELYPRFLENLISDQLTTAFEKIAIVEDKIRLHCAAMGIESDADINNFIRGSGFKNSNSAKDFALLSSEDGEIYDLGKIKGEAEDSIEKQKFFQNKLDGQLKIRGLFVLSGDYLSSKLYDSSFNPEEPNAKDLASIYSEKDGRVENIVARIMRKTGEKISSNDFVSSNGTFSPAGDKKFSAIDIYKIYKNISSGLLERQNTIKKAHSLLKNAVEIKNVNSNSDVQNAILMPEYFNYQNIPEIFENLIEDESFDEFGPGSGSRFVIKDSQIKSLTIHETPPNFTSIVVTGSPDIMVAEGPQALNAALIPGQNGNFQNSAAAVDYDMWRMYGFKGTQTFNAPFLRDPESQCAPMAVSILNKARSEIFSGSVSIIGNEYMQPGDVVYIEGRDLLFYVKKVTHNFNYNSKSFDTSLEINYGRPPGEYIPTKMDLIGKVLFKNRDSGSIVLHRQSSSNGEKPIGSICIDPGGKNLVAWGLKVKEEIIKGERNYSEKENKQYIDDAIFGGKYGEANQKTITQIMNEITVATLQNQDENTNVLFKISPRMYSKSNEGVNPVLDAVSYRVLRIINGAQVSEKYINKVPKTIPGDTTASSLSVDGGIETNEASVVRLRDPNETRSPSFYCMDLAKKIILDPNSEVNSEEDIICEYILDFFLVTTFESKK